MHSLETDTLHEVYLTSPPAKVQVFITFWEVFLQLHSENCDSVKYANNLSKKKIQCVECGGNRLKLRFPIIILIYFHIAETLLAYNFCKSLQLLKEGQYQFSERSQSLEVWPRHHWKHTMAWAWFASSVCQHCWNRTTRFKVRNDRSAPLELDGKMLRRQLLLGTNQMLVDMNQSCYV